MRCRYGKIDKLSSRQQLEAGRESSSQFRCLCHQAGLPGIPVLLIKEEKDVPADPLDRPRALADSHEAVQLPQQRSSRMGTKGLAPLAQASPELPLQSLGLTELRNVANDYLQ